MLPYDSFLYITSATVLFEFDLMALIKFLSTTLQFLKKKKKEKKSGLKRTGQYDVTCYCCRDFDELGKTGTLLTSVQNDVDIKLKP